MDRPPAAESHPEVPRPSGSHEEPRRRSLLDALLAIPLVGKLVGANALILLAASVELVRDEDAQSGGVIAVVALAASFAVNVLLVWVALRPLAGLETMARHIEAGELDARVPRSAIADRDLARIGDTLNQLVDRLTGDRARMRELATQVIRAQDEERARVARELHDSTAQTFAAALLQLRALSSHVADPVLQARLATVRETVAEGLEEVRTMAHTMYPRILDDLGLGPALEWLAARAQDATGIVVRVERDDAGPAVPATVGSVLYRVAQEGLQNALAHSGATNVVIRMHVDARTASIEIEDDGRGFDPEAVDRSRAGMGLFAMRERAALVDGTLEIQGARRRGTLVKATVPLAG